MYKDTIFVLSFNKMNLLDLKTSGPKILKIPHLTLQKSALKENSRLIKVAKIRYLVAWLMIFRIILFSKIRNGC